ncbi:MAG: thymidine phosphorylase [Clostridia bacterium]
MRAYDIIDKKRLGKILTQQEIDYMVNGFTNGEIPDYQMSALLMAICTKGMDEHETYYLTNTMLNSGDKMDMSKINGIVVDKHSTGGVGDTVTLVLAPVLACCGVKLAKLSGRGLGFTGGTIDKLESIPGFDTSLDEDKFFDIVNSIGCAVIGQTKNLVPADKKLYALRDVTATVSSLPLICSSIMSKKLASGANTILLDVKYGQGAFMKTPKLAVKLAELMVKIGSLAGKKVSALVTDMEQPLSQKIGNSIEVISAVEVLSGQKNRLYNEMKELGGKLLSMACSIDEQTAQTKIELAISSGKALQKFIDMVKAQSGDSSYITDTSKFALGEVQNIYTNKNGYVYSFLTQQLGNALTLLGGGRIVKTDSIDNSVGIEIYHAIGDKVNKGDKIATIYHANKNLDQVTKMVTDSIIIKSSLPKQHKIAYAYVSSDGVKYM